MLHWNSTILPRSTKYFIYTKGVWCQEMLGGRWPCVQVPYLPFSQSWREEGIKCSSLDANSSLHRKGWLPPEWTCACLFRFVRTQIIAHTCISQPAEVMRWATEKGQVLSLLCLSAPTLTPLTGFCSALCHSCGVSFSLLPFLQGSPPPSALKLLLGAR